MKKYSTGIFLLFIVFQAAAHSFQDQLEKMNANWTAHRSIQFAGNAKYFPDDKSFVHAHFAAVEIVLRNADVSALSAEQLAARKKNIEVLHAYATRGIFPANHCGYTTPVFIDEFNTHCAVGHLMQQSGFEAMAVRISSRNNYVHAADINDPEIYAWQEASGFTMQELALIQPAYAAPPEAFEQQYACTTAYFTSYAWQSVHVIGEEGEPLKHVWYSGECDNNVLNGTWIQYHSPDVLWIRGNFKNGKKDGVWKYFFNSHGKEALLEKLETWLNGKLHGPYASYDHAGKKTSDGNYANGLKSGTWLYWQQDRLARKENYNDGKLDGEKIQYYTYLDSTQKHVAQHDLYEDGVLLEREIYTAQDLLTKKMIHLRDNRYYAIHYSSVGRIEKHGEEFLAMRRDSLSNDFYPNLPKTYHEYEVLTKVGRWAFYSSYPRHLGLPIIRTRQLRTIPCTCTSAKILFLR